MSAAPAAQPPAESGSKDVELVVKPVEKKVDGDEEQEAPEALGYRWVCGPPRSALRSRRVASCCAARLVVRAAWRVSQRVGRARRACRGRGGRELRRARRRGREHVTR